MLLAMSRGTLVSYIGWKRDIADLERELVSQKAANEVRDIACRPGSSIELLRLELQGVPSSQLARNGRAIPSHDCRRMFSTTWLKAKIVSTEPYMLDEYSRKLGS